MRPDTLALDVDVAAYTPLDALFALPRLVLVEIEQRSDGWCVEVAYWHAALGTLAQYEVEAAVLSEALARCVCVGVGGIRKRCYAEHRTCTLLQRRT